MILGNLDFASRYLSNRIVENQIVLNLFRNINIKEELPKELLLKIRAGSILVGILISAFSMIPL